MEEKLTAKVPCILDPINTALKMKHYFLSSERRHLLTRWKNVTQNSTYRSSQTFIKAFIELLHFLTTNTWPLPFVLIFDQVHSSLTPRYSLTISTEITIRLWNCECKMLFFISNGYKIYWESKNLNLRVCCAAMKTNPSIPNRIYKFATK